MGKKGTGEVIKYGGGVGTILLVHLKSKNKREKKGKKKGIKEMKKEGKRHAQRLGNR